MNDDCIFCKIASGQIKSDIISSNDDVVAFNDIAPQAPVHILVVPKEHISKLEDTKDFSLINRIFSAINDIVYTKGLQKTGYRVVVNSGHDSGQAVDHLHFHILGGRKMTWPPG